MNRERRLKKLDDIPINVVGRLDHYFRTYKLTDPAKPSVEIETRYGREQAHAVVAASIEDYEHMVSKSTVE